MVVYTVARAWCPLLRLRIFQVAPRHRKGSCTSGKVELASLLIISQLTVCRTAHPTHYFTVNTVFRAVYSNLAPFPDVYKLGILFFYVGIVFEMCPFVCLCV